MTRRPLAVTLALLAAACGSSTGGGPSTDPAASPSPTGPPVLTITAAGVDPQVLHTFDSRETVTFVNADSRTHELRSDPHPDHTECPAISGGPIAPGERREIAGPSLPRFTLCFYHEETEPANNSYRGVVVTH